MDICVYVYTCVCCAVRRRAAAKKKKLKNLGKSKSTDTEEEEGEDDQDDGELYFAYLVRLLYTLRSLLYIQSPLSLFLSFLLPLSLSIFIFISSQSVQEFMLWSRDQVHVGFHDFQ